MSVDVETCHIVVMNDDEMEVLKLIANGVLAIKEGREPPPSPDGLQAITMFNLFQRILEM